MIKLENTEVMGWEAAIRGMRNPLNSWKKSDSDYRPILCKRCDACETFELETWEDCDECEVNKHIETHPKGFLIGPNDYDLMKRLRNAGTDHRKFMRMITVYVDITAPLYFWKEHDQYKVGTTTNSCSTMHKIHAKEFTIDDFSHEHLTPISLVNLNSTVRILNIYRNTYLYGGEDLLEDGTKVEYKPKSKDIWWQMIQLLPSSYNQRRTVLLNYEVLANMYKSRKNHKLDEWHVFCDWIRGLPYSELITGEFEEKR